MRTTLATSMLALFSGCPKPAAAPHPPVEPVNYYVGVVAKNGQQSVAAIYDLSVTPHGDEVWTVATVRTRGSLDSSGETFDYDSEADAKNAPWPFMQQHAIAAIPADIRMGADGRAEEIVDVTSWEAAGLAALAGLGLPDAATPAGLALIDPEGLLADLRRSFPGTPQTSWTRDERIAGLDCTRVETCTVASRKATRTWTCTGTVVGPPTGSARLKEADSWTTMTVDQHGLLNVTTGYAGVLLMYDPESETVIESMVGGKRVQERR